MQDQGYRRLVYKSQRIICMQVQDYRRFWLVLCFVRRF